MTILTYVFPKFGITFDVPNLYSIVYEMLRKIPSGKITTYGEIARALGDIRAARAVGRIVALNKWPDIIPCYKVIHSDSRIGKYSGPGGYERKKELLMNEGIDIANDKVVRLERFLWRLSDMKMFPFLKSLQRMQSYLSNLVKETLHTTKSRFNRIVSCDVAYVEGVPDIAISACVLSENMVKISGISVAVIPVFFPYIAGYLAFRELTPILYALHSLINSTTGDIDCILIDGHGILHPRRFGIASHIGLLLNIPTVGVAKELLVGRVDYASRKVCGDREYYPVLLGNNVMGYCIRKNNHRIFVSPGANIGIDDVLKIALSLPWGKRKEPNLLMLPHDIVTILRKRIQNFLKMRAKENQ